MGTGPRRTLGKRLRRLFYTPEELEAEDLEELSRHSGAVAIAQAGLRKHVRVRGTVTSVTNVAESGWLEASVTDGTGSVTLVWMGRRRLDCVLPGTHLLVTGRLSDENGRKTIYNPDFEVVS